MRRPWIKVETATPDKPEICAIANRLRIDEDMVVGKLIRLWSWVALNRVDGSDLGVTMEFVDKLVSRKGFAAALCQAGWLIHVDGKLSLPNFARHNSDLAKTRALTSQRVARHRVTKKLEHINSNPSVTEPALSEDDPPELKPEPLNTIDAEPAPPMQETESSEGDQTSDESQEDEPLEDVDNVLSINAIPTFKPLHTETALAEALAPSAPTPLPTAPALSTTLSVTPDQETQEATPPKKGRRKPEAEPQPMLF